MDRLELLREAGPSAALCEVRFLKCSRRFSRNVVLLISLKRHCRFNVECRGRSLLHQHPRPVAIVL